MLSRYLFSGDAPDPRILKLNSTYFLTLSTNSQKAIKIISSQKLSNFRNSPSKVILDDSCLSEIWSPELRQINGQLYMYFSALPCTQSPHTLYVMQANDPNDPFGSWSEPKQLLPGVTAMTADGSVMSRGSELFLVYESQETPYGLHIAKMSDPMTVTMNTRKSLITPTQSWHQGVTNGPSFVRNFRDGITFMSYSGGNPGSPDYCIGMKFIHDDKDPMNSAAWEDLYGSGPEFCKDEYEGVYGPGHASFVTSPGM